MDLEIISVDKASLCAFHDDDLHINFFHKCMIYSYIGFFFK